MINGSHSGQCPLIWNLLSSFQMSEHRPSFEKFINHYRFTIFFLSFFFRYSVTITENCYDWGTAYSKPWLERVRDATWLVKWLSSSATCPEMPRWPCGTESCGQLATSPIVIFTARCSGAHPHLRLCYVGQLQSEL